MDAGKHDGGSLREPRVNRPRENRPDPRTTAGQFAYWLSHLLEKHGMPAGKLAESTGVARSTIYRWLAGEGSPSLADLDAVAKALGYPDAWAMKPARGFVDRLKK